MNSCLRPSLLIALIFLRAITIAHYKFGDEAQHLHVIWGWARGFVQYRDLADNHMPLFQHSMGTDLQADRRLRNNPLLDADYLATALHCCLLVHLSDRLAALFPARRRLGSHSSGTFHRLCFLFG